MCKVAALAKDDLVTDGEIEARRHVHRPILVPLLVPLVFLDEMQVVPSHNNCPEHLVTDDNASENPPADRNVRRERTFLVNVSPLDGRLGRLKPQPYLFPPPSPLGSRDQPP